MIEEKWKDIEGFESKYMISNLGNVYSKVSNRLLKIQTNKYGYSYCCLSISKGKSKNSLIHRLVALAFLPKQVGKCQVNHIDGNKSNNNINNLEWVTAKENTHHAYSVGLRDNSTLHNNGLVNSKKVYQLDRETGAVIKVWNSTKEASRTLGIDNGAIGKCCNLKKTSYKGFDWRYEETLGLSPVKGIK